jgi:sulfatase maturation enzyme AslB (radical SAM superfamily)
MGDFAFEAQNFAIDYSLPRKMSYSLETLAEFCRRDTDCVIAFYGGEPLLCIDEIRSIMDSVEARHFTIQTNGLLLNRHFQAGHMAAE